MHLINRNMFQILDGFYYKKWMSLGFLLKNSLKYIWQNTTIFTYTYEGQQEVVNLVSAYLVGLVVYWVTNNT